MPYVFLFIFCHWRSFSPWWPLAFPNFPPPLQNFYVVLPTKKCLVWPFIARSSCLSLFFSLSFSGLLPSLSFSLSFSVFQICRHDNWPKLILWQHLNRNNFRFPFSFLLTLSLVVSAFIHKTPVAMRFPAKITSCCHTCMLIELFYIGMPVVRTDGRSVGRAGVRSRGYQMHRLPNFLTHGSPQLARAPL